MSVHLQRQIDRLKKMILTLSAMVEEQVEGAIKSVQQRDVSLAQKVVAGDSRIDQMEIDIEEECLQTLALYQPVAFDLRFVVAVLKINNDLERIADLGVNMAEQAIFLAQCPKLETTPFDMPTMARKTHWMLKHCLDALVNTDAALAQDVRRADDEVDDIHRKAYTAIQDLMRRDANTIDQCVHYLSISRQLERIADHAVNISEDVIYMVQGDIQRHNRPHVLRAGQSNSQ